MGLDALARSAGNQRRAAEILWISLRELVNRLERDGLPRPRKSTKTVMRTPHGSVCFSSIAQATSAIP
jgi:hypothetical protein